MVFLYSGPVVQPMRLWRKTGFDSGLHKSRSLIGLHGRKNLPDWSAANETLFINLAPGEFSLFVRQRYINIYLCTELFHKFPVSKRSQANYYNNQYYLTQIRRICHPKHGKNAANEKNSKSRIRWCYFLPTFSCVQDQDKIYNILVKMYCLFLINSLQRHCIYACIVLMQTRHLKTLLQNNKTTMLYTNFKQLLLLGTKVQCALPFKGFSSTGSVETLLEAWPISFRGNIYTVYSHLQKLCPKFPIGERSRANTSLS